MMRNEGYLSDGNGIILDDFNQTQRPEGQGTPFSQRSLVANNVIFDNGGHGIHIFQSEHVDVINNTLYQNSKDLALSGAFAKVPGLPLAVQLLPLSPQLATFSQESDLLVSEV